MILKSVTGNVVYEAKKIEKKTRQREIRPVKLVGMRAKAGQKRKEMSAEYRWY